MSWPVIKPDEITTTTTKKKKRYCTRTCSEENSKVGYFMWYFMKEDGSSC
jgi:hypothetical protein